MAEIKRHWRATLLYLIVSTALAASITYSLTSDSARATTGEIPASAGGPTTAPSESAVDPVLFSRVQLVRNRLALANRDLAACGCSEMAAESVLSALISWCRQNEGALQQADAEVVAAEYALQQLRRRISVGPRDEAVLTQEPAAKKLHNDAVQKREALLASADTVVRPQFTSSQQLVIDVARANARMPGYLRYAPDLVAEQHQRIQLALARGGTAADAQATVSAQQKQHLDAAVAVIAQHLPGVTKAEAKVLPIPPQLLPFQRNTQSLPSQ